jgi:hypothetical protein
MPQAITPPAPPVLEQMAVGTYSKIMLFQSPNTSMPWPNQYVMVNGYQVVLEREKELVVSDHILAEINSASEGYICEIQDPNKPETLMKVRKRREDLAHRVLAMGISPQEADEIRRSGEYPVYPAKLSAGAQSALQNLGKKSK